VNRLSVADAARVLGVSVQAIHGKIKRGTIKHETGDDGLTYVYIEAPTDSEGVENGVVNDLYNAYIDALKSEIESLKRDQEERREEARRKDTIIAQLNQSLAALINRVPELEAPSDGTESRVTNDGVGGKGSIPQKQENGSERLSWWRRWFG
jgi:hypothetical protein